MANDKDTNVAAPADMEAVAKKLMEDVNAKAAEIIEAAEAKAKEIVSGAQQAVAETVSKAASAEGPSEEELARSREKVTVELFKDNNLYKDDVYVSVNGENIKIKRGVPVEIERRFAEVLDNSRRQDSASADLNEKLQDDFVNKSKDLQ